MAGSRLFRLSNRDKLTVLASEVEMAASSWSRMKGLLGRTEEEFTAGKGLWILPSQGVHTFGMRFPIDVVYLDSRLKVIHLYRELRPHRLAAVKLRASSVVELPAGTLESSLTAIGDVLELKELENDGGGRCVDTN